MGVDLEEATTVICDCCDEESARVGGSRWVRHLGILANCGNGRHGVSQTIKAFVLRLQWRGEERQFSRFGYASTPAFGREVRAFARVVCGPVETGPFRVRCLRSMFG